MWVARTADNFTAAAKPINPQIMEKRPRISPFFHPFTIARNSMIQKMMSITNY
jgi:hypothetical protein